MKTLFISPLAVLAFFLAFSMTACDALKGDDPSVENGRKVEGEWTTGGGGSGNIGSPRNHRYYFDVTTDNDSIKIKVDANIKTTILIAGPNWYKYISSTPGTPGEVLMLRPSRGRYTIDVASVNRYEIGKYTLMQFVYRGSPTELTKVETTRLHLENEAWPQDNTGGRSVAYTIGIPYYSPRNPAYSFDIISNDSRLDWTVESLIKNYCIIQGPSVIWSDDDAWGTSTVPANGFHGSLDKGTYTITVTPQNDKEPGTFSLDLYGDGIANLQRIPVQDTTIIAKWDSSGGGNTPTATGNKVYEFEVTDNDSYVDINLYSPTNGTVVRLWLIAPTGGAVVNNTSAGITRETFTVTGVDKGVYRIAVGTQYAGDVADFTLSLYGKFKNFKQIQ